jgi:serine protease Do/serine protease DegQ
MKAIYKNCRLALLLLIVTPLVANAGLPRAVGGKAVPSLAPMLEKVTPAVVNIATKGSVEVKQHPLMQDPLYKFFWGKNPRHKPKKRPTNSLGSGVIVDAKKGYILTNHHVIANADEITVTIRNGQDLDAKLIGSDADSDVAVIQVESDELVQIPTADSSEVRVGDFVVAIGNPFGLGQTVTSGIVSALGRTGLGIEKYEDFIQTDASINPGNSGGALVNLEGELIGINTAIIGPSGGNVGIGFAIPINMAKNLMQQIIDHGEVKRGLLGIYGQDLTQDLAEALDLKQSKGVLVN